MATLDASSASCFVFTYKEGLLSSIAHDLKIQVERFFLEVNENSVQARFEANSLRVLCAIRNGTEDHKTLGDSDKQKIKQNIDKDVLSSSRYSEIRFVSSSVTPKGEGFQIQGELTIKNQTKSISFLTKKQEKYQVAEITLHQPDFGIKPYSAMLGTLKIKPDLTVKVFVPV